MKKLNAFYEDKMVGVLTKDDEDVYSFEYQRSWRENPEAFPISLSMPLDQEKFGNKITLSFFENLLPEGEVRRELQESHRIEGVFDFLAQFGQDCAGAITISGISAPAARDGAEELISIDMSKVYKAIEQNHSVAEVISETNPGYLSLAGAQDKFPAVVKDGKFYLPKGGQPTTHIVKVPIWRQGVKESVYNEYFCMQLAKLVGLDVPNCTVIDGEHPLFVIERYDRTISNGNVRRLHQQDLCQAQGFTSSTKYEERGGPSIKQNYDFLTANLSPEFRFKGLDRFLSWLCFNLTIGNNDSHSKNVSILLQTKTKYALAPFYDLMCTAVYTNLDKRFSFLVGGRGDHSTIGKKQIEAQEAQLDIKPGTLHRQFRVMTEIIQKHHRDLAMKLTKDLPNASIPNRICELIDHRVKSFKVHGAL